MKREAKVVIGASYGDEGKGMMAAKFATNYGSILQVAVCRFSGGANAGHTVETSYSHHVFHHFGAGTLEGIETILADEFVVNPVLFWREAMELSDKVETLNFAMSPHCKITTPYDVLCNQTLETTRASERHGSTGVGLGATMTREIDRGVEFQVRHAKLGEEVIRNCLAAISDYYRNLGFDVDGVDIEPFIKMTVDMVDSAMYIEDTRNTLKRYDHVVFEGSQGLLLDQYSGDFPHVTYARTGTSNLDLYLEGFDSIEVCYVTRNHITRHGNGQLYGEVPKPDNMPDDLTNHHNEYQGSLRYAPIDSSLGTRCNDDFRKIQSLYKHATMSLCVTWCNVNNEITSTTGEILQMRSFSNLSRAYFSSCKDYRAIENYDLNTDTTIREATLSNGRKAIGLVHKSCLDRVTESTSSTKLLYYSNFLASSNPKGYDIVKCRYLGEGRAVMVHSAMCAIGVSEYKVIGDTVVLSDEDMMMLKLKGVHDSGT